MTLVEKIIARHAVLDASADKIGIPAVSPGRRALRADRRPLLARVRDAHGGGAVSRGVRPDAKIADPDERLSRFATT